MHSPSGHIVRYLLMRCQLGCKVGARKKEKKKGKRGNKHKSTHPGRCLMDVWRMTFLSDPPICSKAPKTVVIFLQRPTGLFEISKLLNSFNYSVCLKFESHPKFVKIVKSAHIVYLPIHTVCTPSHPLAHALKLIQSRFLQ